MDKRALAQVEQEAMPLAQSVALLTVTPAPPVVLEIMLRAVMAETVMLATAVPAEVILAPAALPVVAVAAAVVDSRTTALPAIREIRGIRVVQQLTMTNLLLRGQVILWL